MSVSSRPSTSPGCGTYTGLLPAATPRIATSAFGRVLDPSASAFKAQSAAEEAAGETRRLWEKHYYDEPFFQQRSEGESSPAECGHRDPLSNQTTLCTEVKEACALVRSEHGFDYDVEACSARHSAPSFSQPEFSEGGSEGCVNFVVAAGARYLQFLGLMKKHGCLLVMVFVRGALLRAVLSLSLSGTHSDTTEGLDLDSARSDHSDPYHTSAGSAAAT